MKSALKKIGAAALVAALFMQGVAAALDSEPSIGAKGAALLDQRTGRVLVAKDAHAKLPMASTTKVMTALLAIENLPLDRVLATPKEAYAIEGSSIYLNLGEKMSVEDLLYGLMLSSGNDAAITLAIAMGGSLAGFAQMMNNRAGALGAHNTNFVTPNGLPDDAHYTSAYDLALISRAAMSLPGFRTVVSTQYWKTKTGDIARTFKNKNKLLWQYAGGNGVKTGFTKAAGRCLAFSSEREGNGVVGVVLGAPDMWNDAKAMMDYAYANYRWENIVAAGEQVKAIPIKQGMSAHLAIIAKEDILIPMKQGEDKSALEIRVDCPYSIEAPVYAGQVLGKMEVYMGGACLAATPLIAQDTVLRKEYPYYLWRIIQEWVA